MTSDNHQAIDWDAVWKSLAWDEMSGSDEAITQRLRQRARQYAAPKLDNDLQDGKVVLAFGLGTERYGIDVASVLGVRAASQITRVPGVPAFYRGVVNMRGQVITVLDLRLFFDMPVDDGAARELVIVSANHLLLGLLASHIEGVSTISETDIQPVDTIRYADGVTADRLVLLDINRLFEDPRLIVSGKEET